MKNRVATTLLTGALLAGASTAAPPPAPSPTAAANPPVARVAGQVVTAAELAAEAKGTLDAAEARHAEELYEIRSRTLDAIIERRLLEAKAKAESLTVDALVARDVTSKVAEPADATLKDIYDRTKATGRPVPPYDQAKPEIARAVKEQQTQELRQAYVARLRTEGGVETMLPPYLPPKVDVKADGPARGDANAPVTIVEFSDYECGFCGEAEVAVKRLLDAYKGKVRLVLQPFPLPIHPFAPKAAEAALCAGDQGKYWEMHDALYAHQGALAVEQLKAYARTVGVEGERFDACLDSGRKADTVAGYRKAGEGLALQATPTFYINGRPLVGAQPYEKMKGIVDHELSAAAPAPGSKR